MPTPANQLRLAAAGNRLPQSCKLLRNCDRAGVTVAADEKFCVPDYIFS